LRDCRGGHRLGSALQRVDLRQNDGEFGLQFFLCSLIIFVREFPDTVFELQIPEILVNRGFPAFEMLPRGDTRGLGRSFRRTANVSPRRTTVKAAAVVNSI